MICYHWFMTLIQFIDRVIQKVAQADIQPVRSERGLIDRDDKSIILGFLKVCQQYANHKGTKFWYVPNKGFKSHWVSAVPLIKKHIPDFFDEFKDDDQARVELAEILGKA